MPPIENAAHEDARPYHYSQRRRAWYKRKLDEWAAQRFFGRLIKRTNNFDSVRWLGQPVWQNVLDLWTIQQTIAETRPDAIIETGTNRGGSSLFFAHLFDLMHAADSSYSGHVLTIDIERLHALAHPRVTFLIGSSVDAPVLQQVRDWLAAHNARRVMVILDSDHSKDHVARELEAYTPLVSPGMYLLCQDGVLDTLPLLKSPRAGPLPAIREFLARHPEFEVDHERCDRFIITTHPLGWLRRKP